MQKLPKTIPLLGYDISVSQAKLKDAYAEFRLDDWSIKISDACPDAVVERALLHEAVHACLYLTGVSQMMSDELEEAVCHSLENLISSYQLRKFK